MKDIALITTFLLLLTHTCIVSGERMFLHDARYPIDGCEYNLFPVPNVIGLFDITATPEAILLQWLDPGRMLRGESPCARLLGGTSQPTEVHEIRLSMTVPWNMHYAVDLVDGSFSTGVSNNRTYGQHSIQISPGNEGYAFAFSRESQYTGWPDIDQNTTQTTYMVIFFDLEWNGTKFSGFLSHEDVTKNSLFDCTNQPTKVFSDQFNPLSPTYCPFGVNQTYYHRIRLDSPPIQPQVIETQVPVPVPVPVPSPCPLPTTVPQPNQTVCPICKEQKEPIDSAREAQDGIALFMSGLKSENANVAVVFVFAVIGCIMAPCLLVACVVILVVYYRKRKGLYQRPPLNVDEDYIVSLSDDSNQLMHDIRGQPGVEYNDDGTESSTPRAASEDDQATPKRST